MKTIAKTPYFIIILVIASVVIGTGFVYAETVYPGLILQKDKNAEKKMGYKGLIPGKANDFNPVSPKGTLQTKKQVDKKTREHLKYLADQQAEQRAKQQAEQRARQKIIDKNKAIAMQSKPVVQDNSNNMNSLASKARRTRPETLEDVNIEALKARGRSIRIEDSLLEGVSLPPSMIESLLLPPPSNKDGLSITESSGKFQILQLFSYLDDAKTKKERKEVIKKIKNNLKALEVNYQRRRDLPRNVLLKIGLPKVYIERQEKDLDSVLDMIKSAQKELRKYR